MKSWNPLSDLYIAKVFYLVFSSIEGYFCILSLVFFFFKLLNDAR